MSSRIAIATVAKVVGLIPLNKGQCIICNVEGVCNFGGSWDSQYTLCCCGGPSFGFLTEAELSHIALEIWALL